MKIIKQKLKKPDQQLLVGLHSKKFLNYSYY